MCPAYIRFLELHRKDRTGGCTKLLMTSLDWWGKNEGQTHQELQVDRRFHGHH